MKNISFISCLFLLLIISACTNGDNIENGNKPPEGDQQKLLTVAEIDAQIKESFELNGTFDWKDTSNQLLWSAAIHGNNILTVGYGAKDESFSFEKSNRLTSIKQEIINTIKTTASVTAKSTEDILVYEDETLNYIDVKVSDLSTVAALRKNSLIRYLEPNGYVYGTTEIQQKSSSGCSQSGETISSSDYGTLSTGARVPWNFYDHNINQAWAYSKGRGVGVGLIDTGVSSNQPYLGVKFDDYYGGRYIQKYGTYVDSFWPWSKKTDGPNDKCGHGTSASATIAAPNNNASQFIGVAYECNLISYRGTSDVVLNGYHERKGVSNALKALGNRSDVKIISMSIGYMWSIGNVKDAIKYAHAKGKLIFAAGGTSTSFTNWYGVIFPATMSETIAVTGVEEQSTYNECDTCHEGSKIDFTIIMERGNNHHVPVLGFNNGQSQYFGGSSEATATTAGIAALIWSRYPSWTRAQVLQRLKESADFYPNKNNSFGYGNIDALKAVRGY
tara:strand:+ start:201288 stop:202793 length:1506 start_codon:yes stop_codon:yes gene_type:complete